MCLQHLVETEPPAACGTLERFLASVTSLVRYELGAHPESKSTCLAHERLDTGVYERVKSQGARGREGSATLLTEIHTTVSCFHFVHGFTFGLIFLALRGHVPVWVLVQLVVSQRSLRCVDFTTRTGKLLFVRMPLHMSLQKHNIT